MVSSGHADGVDPFAAGGKLSLFNRWWSQIDSERTEKFYPRDFLWYDREARKLVWYYALPDGMEDTGGYQVVDFEGGMYVAHISTNGDEADGEQVYRDIKKWVAESGCFELDERPGHYDLCHVTTPKAAQEAMGYSQLDIYVPIKVKA